MVIILIVITNVNLFQKTVNKLMKRENALNVKKVTNLMKMESVSKFLMIKLIIVLNTGG